MQGSTQGHKEEQMNSGIVYQFPEECAGAAYGSSHILWLLAHIAHGCAASLCPGAEADFWPPH